jgi:hypothetical protein
MSDSGCINNLKEVRRQLENLKTNFSQPDPNDKNSAAFFKQAAVEWMKVICDAQHDGKFVKQELFDQIQYLIENIIHENSADFLKEIKRSFFAIDDNGNNCLQNAMISMYGILLPNAQDGQSSNIFTQKMVRELLKNQFIKEKIKACFEQILIPDTNVTVMIANQLEVLSDNTKMVKNIADVYLKLNFPEEFEKEVIQSVGQRGGTPQDTRAKSNYGRMASNPENNGILQEDTLKAVNYVRTPPKTIGGLLYTNAELLAKVRVEHFKEEASNTTENSVIGQMKGGTGNLLNVNESDFHKQAQTKLLNSIGQLVERAAQEPKKTSDSMEGSNTLSILESLKQKFAESLEKHFDTILKEDFAYTNLFYFGLSYTPDKNSTLETHTQIIYSKIHLAISDFLNNMRLTLQNSLKDPNPVSITEDTIQQALDSAISYSPILNKNNLVKAEHISVFSIIGGSDKSPKKTTSIYKKYTNHFKTLKKLQHTNHQTIRQKTTSK